jgi:hypothetical protein
MFNPQQTIQHIFKQLSLASQSRKWSKESRISEREKQIFPQSIFGVRHHSQRSRSDREQWRAWQDEPSTLGFKIPWR